MCLIFVTGSRCVSKVWKIDEDISIKRRQQKRKGVPYRDSTSGVLQTEQAAALQVSSSLSLAPA